MGDDRNEKKIRKSNNIVEDEKERGEK